MRTNGLAGSQRLRSGVIGQGAAKAAVIGQRLRACQGSWEQPKAAVRSHWSGDGR